jgi:neutral ceramidase
MRVGTAWEDITPDQPLPLLGQHYVRQGQYARDPLTVNAVVLDDTVQRLALVSVDVCFLPDALVRTLQQACAATAGVAADAVVIAATHTHVAPHTTQTPYGSPDPTFIARLTEATARSVQRAIVSLEECELFAGTGYLEHLGWNRRGMRRDGTCQMYYGSYEADFAGSEGPRDGELGVVFARRPDGQVKAVIPSFSTHPTCLAEESFYSADLPGEVRRVLRAALGADVGIVYLTGAAGNTAPAVLENNPQNVQPWHGEQGLVRSGLYLGGEILKVMAAQAQPIPNSVLRHEHAQIAIPMRPWNSLADLSWTDVANFVPEARARYEQNRAAWPRLLQEDNPVQTHIHVVRLGDVALCCNPAELFVEFGLAIKQRSPARMTLISELSDGYIGYVPTPEAIRHGGYSALREDHTRLVPDAGWTIVDTTEALLQRAFAGP